eukprot:3777922-Rhodomonas_salina.1
MTSNEKASAPTEACASWRPSEADCRSMRRVSLGPALLNWLESVMLLPTTFPIPSSSVMSANRKIFCEIEKIDAPP